MRRGSPAQDEIAVHRWQWYAEDPELRAPVRCSFAELGLQQCGRAQQGAAHPASPAVALPAEQAGEHPTGGDQSAQPGQSGLGPGRAPPSTRRPLHRLPKFPAIAHRCIGGVE